MTKFIPITTDADERQVVNTAHIVRARPYSAMADGAVGYKGSMTVLIMDHGMNVIVRGTVEAIAEELLN